MNMSPLGPFEHETDGKVRQTLANGLDPAWFGVSPTWSDPVQAAMSSPQMCRGFNQ
jgi:hypothetical protein